MSTPCLEDAKVQFGIRYLESIGLLPYPLCSLSESVKQAVSLSVADLANDSFNREDKPKDMFSIYGDNEIRILQPAEVWGPITRSEKSAEA